MTAGKFHSLSCSVLELLRKVSKRESVLCSGLGDLREKIFKKA